jgi:hypothetical protein
MLFKLQGYIARDAATVDEALDYVALVFRKLFKFLSQKLSGGLSACYGH